MTARLCRLIMFSWLGWRQEGEAPSVKKYMLVAIAHTSAWDFVYGWMATRALGLKISIFVKDDFFVWPIGFFCRRLGLLPVNRNSRTNFVDSVVQTYQNNDSLAALITPEGTRKLTRSLKSGYYHIAKKANIPIVVAGPNFAKKTFTFCKARQAMASFAEDEAAIVAFCRTRVGCVPENTFQ